MISGLHDHPQTTNGIRPEDLDLYALHALPTDEADAVEEALVSAPDEDRASMLAHIASTREVAADLVASARLDVAPPPALRARILEQVAADGPAATRSSRSRVAGPNAGSETPGGADVVDLNRARENRRPRMWTVVGAAAAAIVLLAAGVSIGRITDGASPGDNVPVAAPPAASIPEEVRSMLAADDLEVTRGPIEGAGRATVLASRAEDMAVISMDGLPEPADGRAYQLWLMGDHDPIPAGTMESGQVGTAPSAKIKGISDSAQIGLTEEPAGGSPAPTGEVLLALDLA